jgi:hypothetical protein
MKYAMIVLQLRDEQRAVLFNFENEELQHGRFAKF